ncbi:MAG: ribonuclease PH, partial [Clostridiales bacterium]|nr:ribonuclease PH [Clostridiales bacterium]
MPRVDGRENNEHRPIEIIPNYLVNAHGSCLIKWGNTHVICTAMIEKGVPPFKENSGEGWLSSEYAMLPGSTPTRKRRETLKPDGRSTEIKRLIGRVVRAIVDFKALDGYTVWLDCDVINADGGTRTAAITGSYVALMLAVKKWLDNKTLAISPIVGQIAAVSVGIVGGEVVVDLPYVEDSKADVDMNIVMTESGKFIEIQGTAEG